jgi:glycosyltransferase 2 family protein
MSSERSNATRGEQLIQEQDAQQASTTPRRNVRLFSTVVAVCLAVVLLYLSLRGIEWRRVGQILASARIPYLVLCCVLSLSALFLRSFRWRVLLSSEGQVSVPAAFWATAAGYFGNNFLPARAGEVVRTVMISTRSNLSKAFVLTTALCERLADAIALVTISAVVLLTIPFRPGWLADAAKPFAVAGALGVVALAVLPYLESVSKVLLKAVPLPGSLHDRLQHLIEHSLRGIRSFHHAGRLSAFLGLTAVIWCSDAVTTIVGARALGLSISLPVAFLLIAGLGLGSALPSTPGYVGIYQFVAVNVLTPFGISRTDAIAYILFFQALNYVVIGLWGSVALWRHRRGKLLPRGTVPQRSDTSTVSVPLD